MKRKERKEKERKEKERKGKNRKGKKRKEKKRSEKKRKVKGKKGRTRSSNELVLGVPTHCMILIIISQWPARCEHWASGAYYG